jgi:hypothetical protein
MASRRQKRLPYQFTLGGLIAVVTAICLSLGLFRYAAVGNHDPGLVLFAVLGGVSLMGGAIGAAIGQIFRDENHGIALMGAYLGALLGPPVLLVLTLVLGLVVWLLLGRP